MITAIYQGSERKKSKKGLNIYLLNNNKYEYLMKRNYQFWHQYSLCFFAFNTFVLVQKNAPDISKKARGYEIGDLNSPPFEEDSDIGLNKRFDSASFY